MSLKNSGTALILVAFLLLPGVASAELININSAGAGELTTLKGIGEVKAQAIIEYRTRTPFRRIEDIMKVKGIGPATFADLKDFITVGDVSLLPPPPAPKVSTYKPALQTVAKVQESDTKVSVAAAAYAPTAEVTPLWWYLAGLAAVAGLGVAGAYYIRLQQPVRQMSEAEEFEIID